MKLFKKIAMLTMALALTLSVGALAACGGNGESSTPSSSTEQPAAKEGYKFKVVDKNGKPVEGVYVQLCNAMCTFSEATNANGEVVYGGTEGELEYEIHVYRETPFMNPEAQPLEFNGAAKTPATYGDDTIVLTLK